jgi:hypothetical protein
VFALSVSRANFASTHPWNGSRKQTRKTLSPICVTCGFVDDGEIIGTPYCWATRPPASESGRRDLAEHRATLSSVIRRVTAVPASCDFPWSS